MKKPSKTRKLYKEASDRLGLTVNDVPDPRLGNIGSPTHRDHPEIWVQYYRNFCKRAVRGLRRNRDGYPSQRQVRGLRRVNSLVHFPEGSSIPIGEQNRLRVRILALLTMPGSYVTYVRENGITINPVPQWAPISPAENWEQNPIEIVRALAARGLSIDDANDASEYARAWLEDAASDPGTSEESRLLMRSTLAHTKTIPPYQPYAEDIQFRYDEGLGRWMPAVAADQDVRMEYPSNPTEPAATSSTTPATPSSSVAAGAPSGNHTTTAPPSTENTSGLDMAVDANPSGEAGEHDIVDESSTTDK